MKSKALAIAQYIYNRGYNSNLQINKLLYIAFGFYGATYDEYLFDSKIEAWKYGPVIPVVYNCYHFSYLETQQYATCGLSEKEIKIIDTVLEVYGKKEPFLLVEMTHQKNTPWSKFYVEGEKNIEIDKKEIISYYKKVLNNSDALVALISTDEFKNIMESLSKT